MLSFAKFCARRSPTMQRKTCCAKVMQLLTHESLLAMRTN
jgi:hypothetical protein